MKIGRRVYRINLPVLTSRLLLVSVIIVMYIGLAQFHRSFSNNAEAVYNGPTTTVTVKSGDSLWRIASSINNGSTDTRDVVDSIMEVNNLVSAELKPGLTLVVPDTRPAMVAEKTQEDTPDREQS